MPSQPAFEGALTFFFFNTGFSEAIGVLILGTRKVVPFTFFSVGWAHTAHFLPG